MSKIVFFCIPAHGHTNPTLGVVKELTAMGHDVFYYSFYEFQERIEAAGAHFISCDAYDLGMKEDPNADKVGKDIVYSTELIVRATLAMDEDLTKDMQALQPDVIVGDSVAYWGKLIAQKLHIPFVSSTTTFAFNKKSASILKPTIKEMIRMIFDLPKTKKLLAPLREKGYPAENILSIVQNDADTPTIVYTSKEFQPYSETFSDKYTFVGPSLRPVQTPIEKKRNTLIYISLGTVNNRHTDFYQNCIKAFQDCDAQVILAVGNDTDLSAFSNVPDHISIEKSVDQMAVLAKADVFLSHCGMNSANEGLAFGVPFVLFPQTPEQGGVARRIEQIQAGCYLKQPTADGIKQAVDEVLHTPSYREHAKKIAASFQRCGGAKEAAKAILRNRNRSVHQENNRTAP